MAYSLMSVSNLALRCIYIPDLLTQLTYTLLVTLLHKTCGLKIVYVALFQANIRRKLTKEERLAYIREVREERGKYQSRTGVKQKKVRFVSFKVGFIETINVHFSYN